MTYELPIDSQQIIADVNASNEGQNYTYLNTPALAVNAAIINTAWNLAQTKSTDFSTKVASLTSELPDVSDTLAGIDITAGTVTAPTVAEPDVDIPATASQTDIMTAFDTKYLELVQLLSDKFVDFRATYFPDESAAYVAAEDWLQAAIANPSGGIPATVQAQVLEDDRTRILADAERAAEDVLSTFATKRFPLPPGAAASAVLQIQQGAQDKIAESSRKITVLSIEQMKFAVEKTLSLRQLAMGAAIQYIQALASGPELSSKLVGIGYDAQSKLISAASQFYNARTAAAELTSKVGQFNVTAAMEAASKNQAADLQTVEMRLKALMSEAQGIAQMATSLFNNLHASSSISSSYS